MTGSCMLEADIPIEFAAYVLSTLNLHATTSVATPTVADKMGSILSLTQLFTAGSIMLI